jgi:hypothetical protein
MGRGRPPIGERAMTDAERQRRRRARLRPATKPVSPAVLAKAHTRITELERQAKASADEVATLKAELRKLRKRRGQPAASPRSTRGLPKS